MEIIKKGLLILLYGWLFTAYGQEKKPNIIFIMADDLGWQDVGFMGSQWFETLNLDALAQESMVFSNAYMYPSCSPSRTALLTGKQSFRTGVYNVPVLKRGISNDNIFSHWTVGLEHKIYSEPFSQLVNELVSWRKENEVPLPAASNLGF